MKATVSMLLAFRALLLLVEKCFEETESENLGILAFEMQPAPGSISSDPALFAIWQRLWGEGDKNAAEAADLARRFIAQEANWGSDDDGPVALQQFLKAAGSGASSAEFARWMDCLRQARELTSD